MFGYMLIQDIFIKEKIENPLESAKSLVEVMSLIGHVSIVPIGLLLGWLSDKVRVWILLLINLVLFCIFGILFILFIEHNTLLMKIGYVGVSILNQNLSLLSVIILGKLAKPDSRGTLFGAFGLSGSIGVLLIYKLGSQLYKKTPSHAWPFVISVGVMGGYLLLLIGMSACKKLKV